MRIGGRIVVQEGDHVAVRGPDSRVGSGGEPTVLGEPNESSAWEAIGHKL